MIGITTRLRGVVVADPLTAVELTLLGAVAVAIGFTSLPARVAIELTSTPWLVVAPFFALLILVRSLAGLRRVRRGDLARPETPTEVVRTLWRATETVVALLLVGVTGTVILGSTTGFDVASLGAGLPLLLAITYVVSGYAVLLFLSGRLAGTIVRRLLEGTIDRNGL